MLANFSLANTIVIVILAAAVIAGIVAFATAWMGHPRKRREK